MRSAVRSVVAYKNLMVEHANKIIEVLFYSNEVAY